MKHYYYSEKLDRMYDTPEELKKDEQAYEHRMAVQRMKKEKLMKRAEEVKEAFKHAEKLRDAYAKEYADYLLSLLKELNR